jgi:hypothetical protein
MKGIRIKMINNLIMTIIRKILLIIRIILPITMKKKYLATTILYKKLTKD